MTMFHKLAQSSLLFTALLCQTITSTPVTINGKDINTLIKKNDCLILKFADTDNIVIEMKDNNIEISRLKLNNTADMVEYYNELHDEVAAHPQSKGKVVNLQSGKELSINTACIIAEEKTLLKSHESIDLTNVIIKSKQVVLTSPAIECNNCFVTTDELYIESGSYSSQCMIIHFTFNKDITLPHTVHGMVTFADDSTTANILAVGTQQVAIQFAPHAFE